jgi:hypothetical protein
LRPAAPPQDDFKAGALLHAGTHGTVEWLPGAPLGSSGLSWPDVLLGDLPNAYIYTANNPSESIVVRARAACLPGRAIPACPPAPLARSRSRTRTRSALPPRNECMHPSLPPHLAE